MMRPGTVNGQYSAIDLERRVYIPITEGRQMAKLLGGGCFVRSIHISDPMVGQPLLSTDRVGLETEPLEDGQRGAD